jgi:hypothetical protein
MSFGNKIRHLDVFKKVPSDCSQPTNFGGLISILVSLLMLFFVYTEFSNYLNPPSTAEILPDRLITR